MRQSPSPHITFDERLSKEKARIEAQLKETKAGPQQRLLRRKLQQIETASQIESWLTSKESQPPE